ncbi:MAG: LLM class F420-dependent oxidoreductase, partial [Microthrixaceae bacterium]|nr:LLM class F420-dependent oxidoreductase [Microthrixaceae bacterium]
MTTPLVPQARPERPQLTIQPRNFAAEDPGGWGGLVDAAIAADTAGVDRIIVSDHVVFGERPEAYADPR